MAILFILCVYGLLAIGDSLHEKLSVEPFQTSGIQKPSRKFSWKNCESFDSAMTFLHVDISPDPLILTGVNVTIKVMAVVNLTVELGTDGNQIEGDLSVRLKTDKGYTEVCEIVDETICHYNDICRYLEKECRFPFCKCPLKPRVYQIPNLSFHPNSLPFLLRGAFDTTIFIKQRGKYIGCLDLNFCVTCDFNELHSVRSRV
ncbi:hypothetical protein ACF0H5_010533 [Mactra antiquata]